MEKNALGSPPETFDSRRDTLSDEERAIARWLGKVKFRKRLFGGVSEKDLWKKLGKLNEMYNEALIAERARYDALLELQADQVLHDKGSGGEGK